MNAQKPSKSKKKVKGSKDEKKTKKKSRHDKQQQQQQCADKTAQEHGDYVDSEALTATSLEQTVNTHRLPLPVRHSA